MDISAWLRNLALERYEPAFRENDIDDAVLSELTAEDLTTMGVASVGHRRKLLAAIAGLRAAEPPAGAFAPPHHPPPPASITAEAERRQLTVLFCDLVGSTELSRQLDPEDLREVIRRYQDAVAGVVVRYDGYVANLLGDGIVAYFGWPRADEDQAAQAVRAGLEINAAMHGLTCSQGIQLRTRVGIASGTVVVGDIEGAGGRQAGAIAGETPNLAARLQGVAEPGQTVISGLTRQLVGATFALDEIGPQALKGIAEPVPAWRVTGERSVQSRFEARGGRLTRFVGREQEIALLIERWHRAAAREGQAIMLSGEAGIGKSRIVQTLREHLSETHHIRLHYQCSPFHVTSALYPVIRHFEHAAGFLPEDTPDAKLDKLEAALSRGGSGMAESAPLFAELLSLPTAGRYEPLDLTPEQRSDRTAEALIERLLDLAAQEPVLFVVEDAHWIDPSMRELIGRTLTRIADARVLMLITHRPEFDAGWTRLPQVTMLTLNRLSRSQCAELVHATADAALPDEVAMRIVQRTEGVPLFIEELTRSVMETGGAFDDTDIPETLQGSLLARLDRLGADAKELAQIAAVIGREFSRDLLVAVARRPIETVQPALERLVGAQILLPAGPARDAGYTFRHALIQDAAYQSLLLSRRRQYHAEAALALEEHFPATVETQPELIARHFSEAGMPERALPLWVRTAKRELARSANYEAVSHCERALANAAELPDPEARARESLAAQLLLGQALESAGRLPEALGNWRAAADLARRRDDLDAFAQAAMGFDNCLFLSNEPAHHGMELLEEARARLAEGDERTRCQIISRLARANRVAGNAARANDYNRQALDLARRIGDHLSLFNTLINVFLIPSSARDAQDLGNWRTRVDEMSALADVLDDDDSRGNTFSLDIYVSAEMGDRARMDTALENLSALGETRQRMLPQWIARHGRAMLAILDGRFEAAERHSEAALELGRHIHGQHVEGVYGLQMFTIRREQGRLAEAAPIIKRFVDENPDHPTWKPGFALLACDLGFEKPARRMLDDLAEADFSFPIDAKHSTTLAYLAEVCVVLRDRPRAEQIYARLAPYRDMTVTAGVTTVCYGAAARFLGALAGVLGDWKAAEAHFETALQLDEQLRASPWLAHTQYEFARMLILRAGTGDRPRAESLLAGSSEAAQRLGMSALQQRIRSLLH